MTANPSTQERGIRPVTVLVIATCWVTLIAEGYDLVVYGAVVPSLLEYTEWALTPAQAGAIGSYAIIGMLFGALIGGTLSDLIGRKKALILCVIVFSVGMGLCAIAPTPGLFGLFRFIAGLGLGGGMPTVVAFTSEYAPPKWRTVSVTFIFSGFAMGAVLASLLAIPLIPTFGWPVMFWIGIIPLFVVVPLAIRFMPESISFLVAHNRRQEAEALAHRFQIPLDSEVIRTAEREAETAAGPSRLSALSTIFSRQYLMGTLCFWLATFTALFMILGMQTWLPQLMRESGYSLGSALSFLLVLNLATIPGTIFTGTVADLWSSKIVTTISFALAAVSISLLSFPLPLVVTYILVGLAGVGTLGSQSLVNAYVSKYYPARGRATALGWSLGVGRLGGITAPFVGGLLLSSQLALQWNFYAFALAGVLGAVAILLLPRSPMSSSRPEVTESAAAVPPA